MFVQLERTHTNMDRLANHINRNTGGFITCAVISSLKRKSSFECMYAKPGNSRAYISTSGTKRLLWFKGVPGSVKVAEWERPITYPACKVYLSHKVENRKLDSH
ncbi:hypothetical protein BaRGS_00023332 [Batillaria attramentaria]|uniref:Uncharacterized protein n=1 Tax=Batillaria attramentaria TaxID=370345 RepID=A0ABD0KE42_9CAEN